MDKYHFNIRINIKDNNAGSKATEDCKTILLKYGFKNLELSFIKAGYLLPLNFVRLFSSLIRYFFIISPKSFIVVQYPLLGINRYFKYFIKLLKVKGCKFCCIVHDLDSLRPEHDKWTIEQELRALSAYDAVISHNSSMTGWLREQGYQGHIEEILLFDYLSRNRIGEGIESKYKGGTIAFAGSLSRGTFLNQLAQTDNSFYLNLYGSGFNKNLTANSRIKWFGSFAPDEVVNEVTGDFGLVWDGDSTKEISGVMGNYIKFNTTHKTSLYLAAGIPVIVSKNAAIAPFIKNNKIGVCVNSLYEINSIALEMERRLYNEMRDNARKIGVKLREGQFLQRAVFQIEQSLFQLKVGEQVENSLLTEYL
jgi:hypothetical protein